MKKLNKILLFLICSFIGVSCEKHVVEYKATPIDEATTAEFQLFYMVPVVSGASNTINRVELNDKLLSNETAPISVFNFVPSGAVGRFFATTPSQVNLKMYKGVITDLLQTYDQNFDLPAGKHNVVVHDFEKPPVILSNQEPYPKVTTENTGTTAWVRFYNFLYETSGVPTSLKLQYQFQYTVNNETGEKSEWANLGNPVSFGEGTGWEPVTVNKTVEISSGTARIDYRIRMVGANGSDEGSLVIRNTSGNMIDYNDFWNASIGRVYHHMLAGFRQGSPGAAVRQATAY
ncbi:MAG: hypothetical protein ACTJHT_03285 [Sphingobacterium sp.]|uniref:hypothetical protein n=1 Tax=Sphingobacterium sp. JB170 TaxID=1434842 RepID=UPI00097F4A2B|nr:hypothetical protein [Sphingobacterium sp. JB170]SJN42766.1 hypothetical protein FM107_11790 [Sphingobacterium sp. JB170]